MTLFSLSGSSSSIIECHLKKPNNCNSDSVLFNVHQLDRIESNGLVNLAKVPSIPDKIFQRQEAIHFRMKNPLSK